MKDYLRFGECVDKRSASQAVVGLKGAKRMAKASSSREILENTIS